MAEGNTKAAPGSITDVAKDALYVQTGDGILRINEIQLEGKNGCPAARFCVDILVKITEKLGE